MTPEARAKLREGIEEIYREFVSRVAEGGRRNGRRSRRSRRAAHGSDRRRNRTGWSTSSAGSIRSIELLRKRAGLKPTRGWNSFPIRRGGAFSISI